jgi:hypothetical protein
MCFDSDECNLSFVVCIVYSSANMNVHYQNQQVTFIKDLGTFVSLYLRAITKPMVLRTAPTC